MEEVQTPKANRELYIERLKAKHPDREYADDEALFGQAGEDYDAYEQELNGYREREGKFTDMLNRNPSLAQFIADMARDESPWISVIKRIGSDGIIELINDPEKQAAYEEADKEYAKRVAEERDLEEAYSANMVESQKVREDMDARYGEETVDAALAVIDQMCKDAIMGKVTKDAIEMAIKIVNHDADMANARVEGEVAGRNAKIEERMRHRESGDGMPQMGGANTKPSKPSRPSFFDYAEAAS